MFVAKTSTNQSRRWWNSPARASGAAAGGLLVAGSILALAVAQPATARVGESYIKVTGIDGGWKGADYKKWIRLEGFYWGRSVSTGFVRAGGGRSIMRYSLPGSTISNGKPGQVVISIDKTSRAYAPMMALCKAGTAYPDMTIAESADAFRQFYEVGDRPAAIPAFFEYKISNARVVECPVDEKAKEQGFVLSFDNAELTNYRGTGEATTLRPAVLPPAQTTGQTRTYVVSWFGFAHDVSDTQCPQMTKKHAGSGAQDGELPGAPPPAVARPAGGGSRASTDNGSASNAGGGNPATRFGAMFAKMEGRGPAGLNICMLPGLSANPGIAEPHSQIARGFNLDGDATGKARGGMCKHANYTSDTGEVGIDNQLFRVAGCIAGLQGRNGTWMQTLNEERRSGLISAMIAISGIDDIKNDDRVDITIMYSKDPIAKDATGLKVLSDYTFGLSTAPELTHFFTRIPAKIVNGVVVTDRINRLDFNLTNGPRLSLADARMRFEFLPNGHLKGLLGGYEDWRRFADYYNWTGFEATFGFQCPALYGALKEAADGLKDPVSGECNGISSAYDIDAVPAFIPPSQRSAIVASAQNSIGRGRK